MALPTSAKTVLGSVAFVASCAVGIAATAYSVTAAYLMGASAQADVDQTTPADPRVLLRNSFQQLLNKANNEQFGTINVDESAVEVNAVASEEAASPKVEVL